MDKVSGTYGVCCRVTQLFVVELEKFNEYDDVTDVTEDKWHYDCTLACTSSRTTQRFKLNNEFASPLSF